MLELRHACLFGYATCSALYRAIRHFAAILKIDYEDWEGKVEQETIKESKLLTESDQIAVKFGKDSEHIAPLELSYVSRYNPVKGLFDSWLTPDPC